MKFVSIATGVMMLTTSHLTPVFADTLYEARRKDWRFGPVIYQVILDRFAPSSEIKNKIVFYPSPKKMHSWNELPVQGQYLDDVKVWSHEIDFWGGDLSSLIGKLDYIKELQVDVLYLNPIFESFTNHKYDTVDYFKVDSAYGTRSDLALLASLLHSQGKKIILDAVLNHTSRNSPLVKKENFYKKKSENNIISWQNIENLPELNYENQNVINYIYNKSSSVIQTYLRNEKIDGWRLDVAFELGKKHLKNLTKKAHSINKQSAIIGEIWAHPSEWNKSLDGIMNMYGREILLKMATKEISPTIGINLWDEMIKSSGDDFIIKSWLVLDNHDTKRLASVVTDIETNKVLRALQFSLPGSPVIYYGSELGMLGDSDPTNRAPMRWDLVSKSNRPLLFVKKLISLRKENKALRIGNFKKLISEKFFAFSRFTNAVDDTIFVVANFSDKTESEPLSLLDGKIMDDCQFINLLTGKKYFSKAGIISLSIPAKEILLLKPLISRTGNSYSSYKRID